MRQKPDKEEVRIHSNRDLDSIFSALYVDIRSDLLPIYALWLLTLALAQYIIAQPLLPLPLRPLLSLRSHCTPIFQVHKRTTKKGFVQPFV